MVLHSKPPVLCSQIAKKALQYTQTLPQLTHKLDITSFVPARQKVDTTYWVILS